MKWLWISQRQCYNIYNNMNYLKVIIILALLAVFSVLVGSCTVVQNGTVTCSPSCYLCDNGTCSQCCPNYYLLSNACIQCTDLNCINCSATRCYKCTSGYYALTVNLTRCAICNDLTAINCQTVNNCSSTSTCVNCYKYGLNNGGKCQACSSIYRNCYSCSNTRCSVCNSGYFINESAEYKQCVACNLPYCITCSHYQTCATCVSGYYSLNGTCQQCILPCLVCDSASNCTTCDTSLQIYILINSTCFGCNTSMAGCSTCVLIVNSTNVTCYSCYAGFYLSGSACISCVLPCFKCSSSSLCLSCANTSYAYDVANSACNLCSVLFPNCTYCNISTCLNCSVGFYLSGTTCTSCNTTFPACDTCNILKCFNCLSGFKMLDNLTCVSNICSSPCGSCGLSETLCLSCIQGYYLSASTCLACNGTCKTCTSPTYCKTCYEEMQYSSGVCIPCLIGQNYNPFTLKCQACPANCLSCSWWNGCYNCISPLYSVVMNKCKDVCGDTYVVDWQCDATVGVANDGCTDSCTVQSNFNCTKALGSAIVNNVSTAVNISQCSYIGPTTISIFTAVQSLFANNLKLGFLINPYLYGMPTSADLQSYLQTIFTLSPFDTTIGYSIQIDQKRGIVYFSIDHRNDISTLIPTLSINFNYLASISPMFQYMSNISYSLPQINQILPLGRLGEPQQDSDLSLAKNVYGWSSALAICSIFIMIFGLFGKQLVGLDQAILCQHVFFLILFYKGKLTLPLLSLSGLKYSTGMHFEDDVIAMNQNQSYILQLDSSSFTNNFNFNLAAYALPLVISFFILLYKLRYKHLPAWRDLAQQTYEVMMGETILYLVMFNFSGLIAYSYLFYTSSSKSIDYYDSAAISFAVLMTLFAFFNFFFKPEIVGMFRSAFKTESDQRDNRRSKTMEKFLNCISKRFCEEKLKIIYAKVTINFYFIYVCYLIIFVCFMVFSSIQYIKIILGLGLQLLIFVAIAMIRPHFDPFEKLRGLLTWLIVLLGTVTVASKPEGFILPIFFLILLAIHLIGSILIIIRSIWQQIKRKCNDRSEVVKKMMREGQIQGQKHALRELILRFQNIDKKSYSISSQVEKIQFNFKQDFNQHYQQLEVNTPKQQIDQDKIHFQQEIIRQQHEHFRYQKGLEFFDKYANTIDLDLIKEYPEIEDD